MSKEDKHMQVPEDYFKKRKQEFSQYIAGDEDMLDITETAPLLTALKKKEGFLIPENYFENVASPILGASRSRNKSKVRSIFYYAAAASVLCLLGYFGLSVGGDYEWEEVQLLDFQTEEDMEDAYSFLLDELDEISNEVEEEQVSDEEIESLIDDITNEIIIEDLEDLF